MYEKKAREYIEFNLAIMHETILQDRPCTAIEITTTFFGDDYKAVGFSKVNWPDQWDAEYGVTMARKKALAQISKVIMSKLSEEEKTEYADAVTNWTKADVAA